ncbi:hypothetical protein BH23ACT5_BH23ACT5_02710 [soil metagenome]
MTVPSAYPEASQATSALIWSIVGLVCCGPAAIVGFIQGKNELDAIAAGRRDPTNQGTANAAKIIAIVVAVLYALSLVLGALVVLGGLSFGIFDELSRGF